MEIKELNPFRAIKLNIDFVSQTSEVKAKTHKKWSNKKPPPCYGVREVLFKEDTV